MQASHLLILALMHGISSLTSPQLLRACEPHKGRIENYLVTGEIVQETNSVKRSGGAEADSKTGLHLDKMVVNYKSDPVTREFFKKNIPQFKGFSAHVQKDLKERLKKGEQLDYGDLIELHKEFLRMKCQKHPKVTSLVAHDSCQFNQFQIDYKNDKQDAKVHSLKEAWFLVRNSSGDKTYKRYRERIAEIRNILK